MFRVLFISILDFIAGIVSGIEDTPKIFCGRDFVERIGYFIGMNLCVGSFCWVGFYIYLLCKDLV